MTGLEQSIRKMQEDIKTGFKGLETLALLASEDETLLKKIKKWQKKHK